jgi:nitroreductase
MTTVSDALRTRISIRSFLPTPVPRELVHEILDVARYSPSGGNVQPWRVIAVAGAARQAVIDVAEQVRTSPGGANEEGDDPIYPPNLWEPYRTRRYKVGEDLYALLGIAREDRAGRLRQYARNHEFFGAPVGLFFVIDRRFGRGQWAHLGMFMQSIALAAVERGLGTCMQEAWAQVRRTLHAHFALGADEILYCGMALGYPDPDAAVNRLRAGRVAVEEFTDFRGFD